MTVKELLKKNHVNYSNLTEEMAQMPIHLFVSIWEHMDNELKSQFEPVAYICRTRLAQEDREMRQMQEILNEQRKLEEKNKSNWRAENGTKRRLPVKTDEELTREHMERIRQRVADWNHPALNKSLCVFSKIPVSDNGRWTRSSYDKLSKDLFQDGKSTLKEILETVPEIEFPAKNGRRSVLFEVLSIWQEIIINYIKNYSGQLNEHACANLNIRIIIGDNAPYNKVANGNRLLNSLIKIGLHTIEDIFDCSEPLLKDELGPQTYEKLQHLKDDILNNLEEYDHIAELYAEKDSIKELPFDLPQGASLYEQIKTAILQQSDYLYMVGKKRDADIIEWYFLFNLSAARIVKEFCNDLTTARVNQIVSDYARQFMKGPESRYCNRYISQTLIDEINHVSSKCLYKSASEFWNHVAPQWQGDRNQTNNLLRTFFKIDFATPSAKNDAQFWDDNTCICVREGEKKVFVENVLKPIYSFLNTKIEPQDIEDIREIIRTQGHEVAGDTEYFKSVLCNYSKVISSTDDAYQLTIDAYSKAAYRCARYVYDHREENREFSQAEINEQLHLGKCEIIPADIDETLRKIVILRNGIWRYGSYNPSVPYVPIRTLVFRYAEDAEIFRLDELGEYIKQNYQREQPSQFTIYAYATRYCSVSSEDNQLFCYTKALSKHPEFKRKERKEIGAINNYVLQQVHNILIESKRGLTIKELRERLIVPQDENRGYYASRVEPLVYKYANDDNSESNNNPFVLKDHNSTTIIVLAHNHEDFDWDNIGKSTTSRYRDAVVERIIQYLLQCKDFKCTRRELYKECIPLFESVNPQTASTIFYDIINHKLGDAISAGEEDGNFYLWLSPEQRARITSEVVVDEENKEDNYALPERIPYPYGTRPMPKLNDFEERLTQHIRYINLKSDLRLEDQAIAKASQYISAMLFENENIQVFNDLLYGWNEYFNFQIDLRSARSIYSSSLNAYEKYLRELYGIEPSYYNRISGLADTIANIPDLCEEFGYEQIKRNNNKTPIQRIYNSFWLDRNNLDHGENLHYDERFVYTNIRQAIVLYVYAYLKYARMV